MKNVGAISGRSFLAIASFLAIGLLQVTAAAQDTEATPGPDMEVLRTLKEVEWPKAYREQDPELLDSILADEFQVISNDGVWSNKEQELERVRTTKPAYDTFRFEIKRLEIFENGTAIIAGTGHGSGKDKQGRYSFEYQSSNILIKRDGKWKAVSSHVSGYKRLPYAK